MTKRKAEDKKSKVAWTDEEDDALLKAVLEDKQDREAEEETEEEEDWDEISKAVPGKSAVQCFKRFMEKFKDAPDKSGPAADAGDPEAESQHSEEGKDDSDHDGEDEDEGSDSPRKSKRIKKESAGGWKVHEVELLKKLVEQYKDSELSWRYNTGSLRLACDPPFLTRIAPLNPIPSCTTLE